jgi:hypothetical protein
MKQIIKTHQEGLDILDKIDYNERLLKQSIKFEHQCLGRAWPLPDSHFDNKDEIESEIKKLKSHYLIILNNLNNLI